MSLEIDSLIEQAAQQAELATIVSLDVALSRAKSHVERRAVLLNRQPGRVSRIIEWTDEEDAFLAASIGKMHENEIAQALGRSRVAVHIRWKRFTDIPSPSKDPDILTGEQIAEGLHVDGKSVHLMIDRGILPGRRLPTDDVTRVVRRVTLLRFLVNAMNWVYFDPERVGKYGPRRGKSFDYEFWNHARRLVLLARARWTDEWWTVGQVAEFHGVDQEVVNNAIHDGRLCGAVRWGNWYVLKSVAEKCTRLHSGSGSNAYKEYSAGLDELILVGTAIGLSVNVLSTYSGLGTNRICYRRIELRRKKLIAPLIKERGLAIEYNARSGGLFADWKQYRKRFKALAEAMDLFKRGDRLDRKQLAYVRGVLHAWCERFYHERDREQLLRSLSTLGRKSFVHFRAIRMKMLRAGVDVYKRV